MRFYEVSDLLYHTRTLMRRFSSSRTFNGDIILTMMNRTM